MAVGHVFKECGIAQRCGCDSFSVKRYDRDIDRVASLQQLTTLRVHTALAAVGVLELRTPTHPTFGESDDVLISPDDDRFGEDIVLRDDGDSFGFVPELDDAV